MPDQQERHPDVIDLARDVEATVIPDGGKVNLAEGEIVRVLQELGGSFTVMTQTGARYRIEGKDAQALGRPVPDAAKDVEVDPSDKGGVEKAVWKQLKTVHDPEIPFNIVDLGLVYECDLKPHGKGEGWEVRVLMTLTAPWCGMGDILVDDVRIRVGSVPGVEAVDVEITADPPWSMDMMSAEARMALNL